MKKIKFKAFKKITVKNVAIGAPCEVASGQYCSGFAAA